MGNQVYWFHPKNNNKLSTCTKHLTLINMHNTENSLMLYRCGVYCVTLWSKVKSEF